MARSFKAVASGPPRLVWDHTGFPMVPETEADPGIIYHLASRIEEYTIRGRPDDDAEYHHAVATISGSVNQQGRTVGALLEPEGSSFDEAVAALPQFLRDRHSTRAYHDRAVRWDELAPMLAAGLGSRPRDVASGQRRKLVSSPGGLLSIDAYLLIWNVEGLEAGVYFVDGDLHRLRRVRRDDVLTRMDNVQFTISRDNVERAGGAVSLVFVPERLQWKYGPRSYRFGCMEAGHIMHGLCIGAQAAGLGFVPIGGFCEAKVDRLLGLDGTSEMTLYTALFGATSP